MLDDENRDGFVRGDLGKGPQGRPGRGREHGSTLEFDSDEELEGALILIEIARLNGVSNPETLRDLVLARLSDS